MTSLHVAQTLLVLINTNKRLLTMEQSSYKNRFHLNKNFAMANYVKPEGKMIGPWEDEKQSSS